MAPARVSPEFVQQVGVAIADSRGITPREIAARMKISGSIVRTAIGVAVREGRVTYEGPMGRRLYRVRDKTP